MTSSLKWEKVWSSGGCAVIFGGRLSTCARALIELDLDFPTSATRAASDQWEKMIDRVKWIVIISCGYNKWSR